MHTDHFITTALQGTRRPHLNAESVVRFRVHKNRPTQVNCDRVVPAWALAQLGGGERWTSLIGESHYRAVAELLGRPCLPGSWR